MLNSVEDIIDALGGTAAAARLADVSRPAVSMWKDRGRIPPDNFLMFSAALEKKGLCADPAVFGVKTGAPA